MCKIVEASDRAELVPGTLHVAFDPSTHAVIEPGHRRACACSTRIRWVAAAPVRTCCSVLPRLAERRWRGAMLTEMGADDAQGLKVLRASGSACFVEKPTSARVKEAPETALAVDPGHKVCELDELLA